MADLIFFGNQHELIAGGTWRHRVNVNDIQVWICYSSSHNSDSAAAAGLTRGWSSSKGWLVRYVVWVAGRCLTSGFLFLGWNLTASQVKWLAPCSRRARSWRAPSSPATKISRACLARQRSVSHHLHSTQNLVTDLCNWNDSSSFLRNRRNCLNVSFLSFILTFDK